VAGLEKSGLSPASSAGTNMRLTREERAVERPQQAAHEPAIGQPRQCEATSMAEASCSGYRAPSAAADRPRRS